MKKHIQLPLRAVIVALLLLPFSICVGQITGWYFEGQMPVPMNHQGNSVYYDGKIYLLGGGPDFSVCNNAAYAFNPANSVFTPLAPLPVSVCGAAVAATGDKIYVFGGFTAAFAGLVTNQVFEYDVTGNTWTELTPMTKARAYATASVADGKIYVVGGSGDYGNSTPSEIEVFDVASKTWLPLAPPLNTSRGGHVAAVYDDKIYVFSGLNKLGDPTLKTVEMFDSKAPSTGWTVVDTMPTGRVFAAACLLFGRVYLMGGFNDVAVTAAVDMYNPTAVNPADRWTACAQMNVARRAFSAAAAGDRIYVFGGNNNAVLQSVEVSTPIVSIRDIGRTGNFDPFLHCTPNPATGMAAIIYRLPGAGDTQVALYDQFGRLLRVLWSGRQTAGDQRVEFDAGALPKGIYFSTLDMGNGQKTSCKVLVQ